MDYRAISSLQLYWLTRGLFMSYFDIVIVNWNSGTLLYQCIQSLGERVDMDLLGKLVIVDNASSDDSLSKLDDLHVSFTVKKLDRNIGFGAACNLGASECASSWVVFLNPDTRIDESPFPRLREACEQSGVGVVGIKLLDESGRIQKHTENQPNFLGLIFRGLGIMRHLPPWIETGRNNDWDHETSANVEHVIGAFYCIKRSLFEVIGGFDERYFVYFEDMDLSKQVLKREFRILYLAEAYAIHVGGGATEKVKAMRLFLGQNGRVHYARKYMGTLAAVAVLFSCLTLELALRLVRGLVQGEFGEVLKAARMLIASIPSVFSGRPAG